MSKEDFELLYPPKLVVNVADETVGHLYACFECSTKAGLILWDSEKHNHKKEPHELIAS